MCGSAQDWLEWGHEEGKGSQKEKVIASGKKHHGPGKLTAYPGQGYLGEYISEIQNVSND